MNQQITIKAIVIQDGKLLLIQSSHDKSWDLPGGRLKQNEDITETLHREVGEELGVGIRTFFDVPYKVWNSVCAGGNLSIIGIGYETELENLNFDPGPEIADIRWVNNEEICDLILCCHEKVIRKIIERIKP